MPDKLPSMNPDTKSFLIKIFGTISCLIVIFFFATFCLLAHGGANEKVLNEALTASLSFSSVLATIGAAIIAAYLFNDWKIEQRHNNIFHFGTEVIKSFKIFDNEFIEISNKLTNLKFLYQEMNEKNDFSNIELFYSESNAVSLNINQLLSKFKNLHEDLLLFMKISPQVKYTDQDLAETYNFIICYLSTLGSIKYKNDLNERFIIIEELTSSAFNLINTYVYNYYINIITEEIKL